MPHEPPPPQERLTLYVTATAVGERYWHAQDAEHAHEQHEDLLGDDPDEQIVDITSAQCIDGPDGCRGAVEERWPGYGQRTWPRCEHHGDDRAAREHAGRDRIHDGACIPADFDERDAGETWAATD